MLGRGFILLVFLLPLPAAAQINPFSEQETMAYMLRVKQVSQFMARFNNDDDQFKSLFERQKGRQPERGESVRYLIPPVVAEELVSQFLHEIDNRPLLSFADDQWYAKVTSIVKNGSAMDTLLLSLKVVSARNNSFKWVITGAQANFLALEGQGDEKFINPMSHEINFVDLYAVMRERDNAETFIDPSFEGDDLTLLIQSIERGELEFGGVIDLDFFFLQIDDWILGIEDFNNLGSGGGWLISRLIPASEADKEAFKRHSLYINY